MIYINIAYPEKSDLPLKVNKYPDGQQDVVIDVEKVSENILNHIVSSDVTILTRLNNFKDIELLLSATACLKQLSFKNIHVYCPYIIGGRSDRKFIKGGSNYIKDVLAPVLNLQNYSSLTCLDPHSDVLEASIQGLIKTDNSTFVKHCLNLIYGLNEDMTNKFVLLSPDGGSMKKIYDLAANIKYTGRIVECNKHRELATNKITHTSVGDLELNPKNYMENDFIIVDDICDGGRTFVELAKKVKEVLGEERKGKIYLLVTHGIFSASFYELSKHFDNVFSTNSYSDILDIESHSDYTVSNGLLKQVNVF